MVARTAGDDEVAADNRGRVVSCEEDGRPSPSPWLEGRLCLQVWTWWTSLPYWDGLDAGVDDVDLLPEICSN